MNYNVINISVGRGLAPAVCIQYIIIYIKMEEKNKSLN